MRNSKPILLLEDDSVDAMTVRRAFNELKVTNPLKHVLNGEDALDYLQDSQNEKPCMILLDLNMPRMGGLEFLKIIKDDPVLRGIPVVVFTTSTDQPDIMESYKQSAGGYIVKPVDYKKFVDAIKTVNLYWTISEMPQQQNGG
jgi:CheY-like chemotaxis protein